MVNHRRQGAIRCLLYKFGGGVLFLPTALNTEECIVRERRLRYFLHQMGDPAKSSFAPSTNPSKFDSFQPDGPSRALRVLVADDHEMVRIGLCAMLQSQHIEV